MTTIAFRNGILACDSCETSENEAAGTYKNSCVKLFRVGPFVTALRGESSPGMVWLAWFQGNRLTINDHYVLPYAPPELCERLKDSEFTAVVLCPNGKLFEYDEWGTPMPVTSEYYACGSGAKVALGAMHHGATATEAVRATCEHDPYTAGPVVSSENI